jgi:hypothetical protein
VLIVMSMVNRKRISLLTAWVVAAALLTALGSDAFAATGSKVWGRRTPSLVTKTSLSTQARKPAIRPFTGEPDFPQGGAPQPSTTQLPYWQQVLQGLLPLLGNTRLP